MNAPVNIPGVEITLNGQPYVLPPLPMVAVPRCKALFEGSPSPMADETYQQATVDAVYFSLRRNYPDISANAVADGVDMSNFRAIIAALIEVNELTPPPEGEEAKKKKSTGTKSSSM